MSKLSWWAGGATMDDAVNVTVPLSDIDVFDGLNQVYASYCSDLKPTRTTVGSQLLGILAEIDAVAYVGKG
jgi:2-iminobutanoate/2-iminopropanoate deaminase